MIGGLAKEGIRSLPFVWGSPSWVGNEQVCSGHPPIGTTAERQGWQNFLRAAVARYGPGGTYWANKYKQDYPDAGAAVPIQSWQIWNEPNLKKYFSPGSTTQATAQKYAQLLSISYDAIKARDAQAKVVLAGMPSTPDTAGSSKAWDFLDALYGVAGVEADFDVGALHPYGCNLEQTRFGISKVSASMKAHGDGATPLWLTESAWGSGAPDNFCKNKGLTGQRDLLVQLLPAVPAKPHDLEYSAGLLVPVARRRARVRLRRVLQHLRQRRAAAIQPHRKAGPRCLQELHGRDHAARGEHRCGANPGKLHQ